MRFALLAVAVLSAGCLNVGRMESQRSIDELARGINADRDAIVAAAKVNPVAPAIAERIDSMDDKATKIRKWTHLTQADLGRAEGEVDLSDDGQARARAMYEQEIKKREYLRQYGRALAARVGIPIPTPSDASVGDTVADLASKLLGPGVAGVLGVIWRRERKRRKAAEEDRERKRRAVREAIDVIGQSKDTSIRRTASMKQYLLREFADAKMGEYDERIHDLEEPMPVVSNANPQTIRTGTTVQIRPSELLPIDDHRMDAASYVTGPESASDGGKPRHES